MNKNEISIENQLYKVYKKFHRDRSITATHRIVKYIKCRQTWIIIIIINLYFSTRPYIPKTINKHINKTVTCKVAAKLRDTNMQNDMDTNASYQIPAPTIKPYVHSTIQERKKKCNNDSNTLLSREPLLTEQKSLLKQHSTG